MNFHELISAEVDAQMEADEAAEAAARADVEVAEVGGVGACRSG